MKDFFKVFNPHLSTPAENAYLVTPSDADDLPYATRAIYMGISGDLKVDMINGDTVTFVNLPIGLWPFRIRRIYSTGTATTNNIIALY